MDVLDEDSAGLCGVVDEMLDLSCIGGEKMRGVGGPLVAQP